MVSQCLDTIFDSICDLKTHQRGLEHSPLHGIGVTTIINSFTHIIYPKTPHIQPSSGDDFFYFLWTYLFYYYYVYFACTYVCMSVYASMSRHYAWCLRKSKEGVGSSRNREDYGCWKLSCVLCKINMCS